MAHSKGGINPSKPRCNGLLRWRRMEMAKEDPTLLDLPKIDPGHWGGTGYCGRPCGWGTDHTGVGRCKLHGGRNLVGVATGGFESKDHSKYIPAKYLKDYEEGLRDPSIQREQSRELAGLHALIVEAWKRTGDGVESGETWRLIADVANDIDILYRRADKAGRVNNDIECEMAKFEILEIVRDRMLPLIRHGAGEQYAKDELTELWQKRAKLIRVQQQGERTIPIEVLGVLLARTAAIANDVIMSGAIEDQKIARKVLSSFVTRLRMETLPADGAGIVKRLDAQAGRSAIEDRVKDITPSANYSDSPDGEDDGVIDIGRGRDIEAQDASTMDVNMVTMAKREHFRKGVEAGAILASMGIGTSASIADLVGAGRVEDEEG